MLPIVVSSQSITCCTQAMSILIYCFIFRSHLTLFFPGSGAAVDVQTTSHCQRKLSTSLMFFVSSESSMLVPTPGFYKPLSLFQHSYLVSAFTFTSYISDLIPNLLLRTNESAKHIQKCWESLKCFWTKKSCLLSHLSYRCSVVKSFHLGVFWPFFVFCLSLVNFLVSGEISKSSWQSNLEIFHSYPPTPKHLWPRHWLDREGFLFLYFSAPFV